MKNRGLHYTTDNLFTICKLLGNTNGTKKNYF